MEEAKVLFNRVREASELEKALIEKLGICCRIPERTPKLENVSVLIKDNTSEESADEKHEEKSKQSGKPRRARKARSVNAGNSASANTA